MKFISIILDFLFPENITCLICKRPIDPNNTYSLCRECFEDLIFIKDECYKCGKPIINKIEIEKEEILSENMMKEIEKNCIISVDENGLEKLSKSDIDEDEEYLMKKFDGYKEGYKEDYDDIKKDKIEEVERCSFCKDKRFYFDRAISCIEYTEKSKILVLSLKYYGNTYIAKYVANIMKEKIDFECIKADYIIPVPLHKKRMKKRGFNQAEKIAIYLSELTKIPMIDCIKRNKNTKRLYALDKIDREKELKNAFEIKNGSEIIKDKTVFLIDDIFTTGTTTNEISKKLKIYGVKNIIVMTFLTRNIN